jgi:hypothetical protein
MLIIDRRYTNILTDDEQIGNVYFIRTDPDPYTDPDPVYPQWSNTYPNHNPAEDGPDPHRCGGACRTDRIYL